VRSALLLIGSLAFVASGFVPHARADDAKTCADGIGEEKIAACTNAIKSGRWSGRDLAWAYDNRGYIYGFKGEFERALADFGEAIRLDPKDSYARHNRGRILFHLMEYDRALADFNEAIRLDPKSGDAHEGRGNVYYHRGDRDRASADYQAALRLMPADDPMRDEATIMLHTLEAASTPNAKAAPPAAASTAAATTAAAAPVVGRPPRRLSHRQCRL
jgi:tetratricopeptide (TPR) repeat protein